MKTKAIYSNEHQAQQAEKHDCTVWLDLQYFADGDAGDGGGSDAGASGDASNNQQQATFDDVLKDKRYQSEFDKRITKAIETAKAKWDADKQAELDEAKRLEKMTAEQKAQAEREKADAKLKEREAAITARELKATAKELLAEKKLPTSLAELPLDYTSADKCKESLEVLEKAFNEAVDARVNERLKGSVPKAGAPNKAGTPIGRSTLI